MDTTAWPKVCPGCLSKHEDIRGMIYADGTAVGARCENAWHKGPGYVPETLNLTDDDRVFLRQNRIRSY
jgi:hypothetical protein